MDPDNLDDNDIDAIVKSRIARSQRTPAPPQKQSGLGTAAGPSHSHQHDPMMAAAAMGAALGAAMRGESAPVPATRVAPGRPDGLLGMSEQELQTLKESMGWNPLRSPWDSCNRAITQKLSDQLEREMHKANLHVTRSRR